MQIIPAILTDRTEDLRHMLEICAGFCDYVQVDFMDGDFVPSQSVTVAGVSEVSIDIGMEAHMMVREPDDLDALARSGFKQVIFHYEATSRPLALVEEIRSHGMLAGMAVNPDTALDEFYDLVKHVDTVLIMTVNPGFYGSTYQPQALAKATSLRQRLLSSSTVPPSLGVDGGVSLANIEEIAAAGLDFACVGSAIFAQDDPAAAYRLLLERAKRAQASAH